MIQFEKYTVAHKNKCDLCVRAQVRLAKAYNILMYDRVTQEFKIYKDKMENQCKCTIYLAIRSDCCCRCMCILLCGWLAIVVCF